MQNALIGVKTSASGLPMTVEEATDISDNALEHTVRCIMAAVQAPEVLDSSRGEALHDEEATFKGCLAGMFGNDTNVVQARHCSDCQDSGHVAGSRVWVDGSCASSCAETRAQDDIARTHSNLGDVEQAEDETAVCLCLRH